MMVATASGPPSCFCTRSKIVSPSGIGLYSTLLRTPAVLGREPREHLRVAGGRLGLVARDLDVLKRALLDERREVRQLPRVQQFLYDAPVASVPRDEDDVLRRGRRGTGAASCGDKAAANANIVPSARTPQKKRLALIVSLQPRVRGQRAFGPVSARRRRAGVASQRASRAGRGRSRRASAGASRGRRRRTRGSSRGRPPECRLA